jgi:hypothetical protein
MTQPPNARAIQKLAFNNGTLDRTLGSMVTIAPEVLVMLCENEVFNQKPKLVDPNFNFLELNHVDESLIETRLMTTQTCTAFYSTTLARCVRCILERISHPRFHEGHQ